MDFHNLNKARPKDEFPLPNIDLFIDSTAGNFVFSFMDGYNGYNQICMATKDQKKKKKPTTTTFRTPMENFYYTVMSFILKNAGTTYQHTMTMIFHGMMHQ